MSDQGKIAHLWAPFYEQAPGAINLVGLYSIDTHYESAHKGLYNLLVAILSEAKPSFSDSLSIAVAAYLLFENKGYLPQAVIALWIQI